MTHRMSMEAGNNEFVIEQPDGNAYNTALGKSIGVMPLEQAYELCYHKQFGYSPNCVICRDEARKSAIALSDFAIEYWPASGPLRTVTIRDASKQAAMDTLWADADKQYCPAQIVRAWKLKAVAPVADDPTSMADFPTFGADPDEADREAEAAHARHGF